MNAIDFLIKEHDQVKKLLVDISEDSDDIESQRMIFDDLGNNLLRHEQMEHQIWYPNFKDKLPNTVKHLIKEEKHAEEAINKLKSEKSENEWKVLFKKFKKDVEHHADEEENHLFPEVKKILSNKELEEIGLEMDVFKKNHS